MRSMSIFDPSVVTEEVAGETPRGFSALGVALCSPFYAVFTVSLGLATLSLWPVFGLGFAVWGRAPNVPRTAQVTRYLRLIWTVSPPPPGLPITSRVWLTLRVLRKTATIPMWSLAWYLDEVLYGRQLEQFPVESPLFELSAARSGSTQLARYLEDDPQLAGPSFLQTLFPYVWLWRLTAATLGRVIPKTLVRAWLLAGLPPEFAQRHEVDPFRMDTFEVALYLGHLSSISALISPDVAHDDFSFAEPSAHSEKFWTEDIPAIVDRLGRKILMQAAREGRPNVRFFIKGHFLAAADALEARYPDARFLTVIRDPRPRIRSGINYLRANALDAVLKPVPWAWIAQVGVAGEVRYCHVEMAWYHRPGPARRCVVRFVDYRDDLAATLQKIYRECLDSDVPDSAARAHEPRERADYLVDRTLAELGIAEDLLASECAEYIDWCTASDSPGVDLGGVC